MELFSLADRFAIDRLKTLCEQEMLSAIDIDTAAEIFLCADHFRAAVMNYYELFVKILGQFEFTFVQNLRQRCLDFILLHFDQVSRTLGFEEMGRINIDLGEVMTGLLVKDAG
jgi:hypothetical protein